MIVLAWAVVILFLGIVFWEAREELAQMVVITATFALLVWAFGTALGSLR